MDRGTLDRWGLELADDAFALALAALGAVAALPVAQLAAARSARGWRTEALVELLAAAVENGHGLLPWVLPAMLSNKAQPRLAIGLGGARRTVNAPTASALVEVWLALHDCAALEPLDLRLTVHCRPATLAQAMVWLPWLMRPEVGAVSALVDNAFGSDTRNAWRWPFTVATLPGDPLQEALADLQRDLMPTAPFRFACAEREQPLVDVLVIGAGASEALAKLLASGLPLRCSLVMVAGLGTDSPRSALPLLQALVSRLEAEGVAVLGSGSSVRGFAQRLRDFAERFARHGALDVALARAFAPQAMLLLNCDLLDIAPPQDLAAVELEEMPRMSMMAHAKPPAPAAPMAGAAPPDVPEAAPPPQAGPRYVQQKSFGKIGGKFVEERTGYCVGQPVLLQVLIGPPHADTVAAPLPFPEDQLPRNRDTHRLTLVFYESAQLDQPLIKTLLLPREGDSSVASFVFTPRTAGRFAARLSVLHRGRVLQTVLLHTQVVAIAAEMAQNQAGITLDMEVQVHHDWSDLGQRRPFDLALVLNHSAGGQALMTGVAGRRAWVNNLQGIEQPVRRINELISAVAHSLADYGDGLDQGENPVLLVKLARVGANLYSLLYRDQLQRFTTDGLDVGDETVTYLQVVSTRLDAVVPLEFMYDFNAPDPDASVCPQHREALEKGHCPGNCARAAKPRAYVCPMGFWGLKKVIERHMYDDGSGSSAPAMVLQVEALEGRNQLHLGRGALVAHSQEVKPEDVAPLVALLSAKVGGPVPVVKNWDDWLATVKATHPAMLVAFPHNEGTEEDVMLEIGGDKFGTLGLTPDYLHAPQQPPPLVFLLGCDVAGTAQDFSSHIRFFRQNGAAVVVCTIATVFGAHAVRVGQAMVSRLLQPGAAGQTRIGEMLRDAKRAALLDSVPMALCVVAFGDADWRL